MRLLAVFLTAFILANPLHSLEAPQICVTSHEKTKQEECKKCDENQNYYVREKCVEFTYDESRSLTTCSCCNNRHKYVANLDYICNVPPRFALCFEHKSHSNLENNLRLVKCSSSHDFQVTCKVSGKEVHCFPNEKMREHKDYQVEHLVFSANKIGADMIDEIVFDKKSCSGTLIKDQTCDFYSKCLENIFNCGSKGFPIGFGLRYCEKSLKFMDTFSHIGKEWLKRNIVCLKENLREAVEKQEEFSCERVREVGMKAHHECFLKTGFCDLFDPKNEAQVCQNLKGLWTIFEIKDLADFMALKEISNTLKVCRENGPQVGYYELTSLVAKCGYKSVIGDM